MRRQCALLGLSRAALYDAPRPESTVNLWLMRLLDEQYTRTPYYGIRRMTAWLRTPGGHSNPKRVQRRLRLMGLEAIYPKPHPSPLGAGPQVYPYRLRGVTIEDINQGWSSDHRVGQPPGTHRGAGGHGFYRQDRTTGSRHSRLSRPSALYGLGQQLSGIEGLLA